MLDGARRQCITWNMGRGPGRLTVALFLLELNGLGTVMMTMIH